ncbi:entericidin A/B family lipoprotein [uncultured Roseobacter sp.]|nr:entericidin A/B family lipoprotein [uncultured Roseobacter sp.]
MMKLTLALAAVLALAACETTKGLGRDIESAGQALDNAI